MKNARQQLHQRFRASAMERLRRMALALLGTTSGSASEALDSAVVEEVARELHTIKGESQLLGLGELSAVVHQAEELLRVAAEAAQLAEVRAPLRHAFEQVISALQRPPEDDSAYRAALQAAHAELDAQRALIAPRTPEAERRPEAERLPDAVPTPAAAIPPAAVPPSPPPRGGLPRPAPPPMEKLPQSAATMGAERWIHVNTQRVDALSDAVAEFDAGFRALDTLVHSYLDGKPTTGQQARAVREDLDRCRLQLEGLTSAVWALRLVPVEPVLSELARHAHELAQEHHKHLRITLHGGDTQIERTILDALWEPLLHLIRNAVDHGIERPAERAAKGEEAHLSITAESVGTNALITVQDDGRGINPDTVRAAAVARGFVDRAAAASLSSEQLYELLFVHGFSTQTVVSSLSGRGVGLDVVRRSLDAIDGSIGLRSEVGIGTQVTLTVPVRLSKERALVFGYQGTLFAIPARHVLELLRLQNAEVKPVAGGSALWSRYGVLPLRSLGAALGFTGIREEPLGLILTSGNQRWAFAMSGLVGEFEILRQPCDALVTALAQVSACALLGDGRLVLCLATGDLIRRAHGLPGRVVTEPSPRPRQVLVVDDSPIIRDLATQILTGGGFTVRTAEDGEAALVQLGKELPDVVLTDIDMPLLDGFALLARIRAQWSTLPVILFTNHASAEYKRRAVTLGANAYVQKLDFNEASLLQTVQRFAGGS